MNKFLLILLMSSTLTPFVLAQPAPADLTGTWRGTLTVPGGELPLIFHISQEPDGKLVATLDSPNQGAYGIQTSSTEFVGDSLRIDVPMIGGQYRGGVAGDTIAGTWSQSGMSFPLALQRTDEVEPPRRPQTPEPPFPYQSEEVVYDNPAAEGVRLAGTLTLPEGDGPHPAVLLVTGSGAQDRDETIMGHKPFLVLADYLTRRGIAVLRVDDRGTGASTGDFGSATSEDFASDALAGIQYLRSRSEVDAEAVGLIGHSEGALVAAMVAAEHPDALNFLVMMAGPGVPGHELLIDQGRLIAEAAGAPPDAIDAQTALQRQIFDIIRRNENVEVARDSLRPVITAALQQQSVPAESVGQMAEAQLDALTSPWMRFFLFHDPVPVLQRVTVPVLAINGEKDLQVPAETNTAAVEAALRAGGNERVTVHILPGLNHLFQTAATGSPMEYAQIEQTLDPSALEVIGDWIQSQVE